MPRSANSGLVSCVPAMVRPPPRRHKCCGHLDASLWHPARHHSSFFPVQQLRTALLPLPASRSNRYCPRALRASMPRVVSCGASPWSLRLNTTVPARQGRGRAGVRYVPIAVAHAPFWTHTQTRRASPVPLRLATLSSSATTRAGWDTHCQTSGVSATTGASSRSPTRANRTTRSSTLKSLQLHHPVNGGDVGAESGTPGLKAEDPADAYPTSH